MGRFGTNRLFFSKEFTIPLVLYNDDCETVNPLGSKTVEHKLGFLYFTIKSLPPELLSSLNSHFLLAVYKTDDAKTYGLSAVLNPIIDELKILELEGISIDMPHFQGTVKFGVAQVCGDNLGLSGILGFTQSFSGNYVCRWCQAHRDVLWEQTREDQSLLLDADDYQADLCENNPSSTGMREESVLNGLHFFHVTNNVAPDIMHDILTIDMTINLPLSAEVICVNLMGVCANLPPRFGAY